MPAQEHSASHCATAQSQESFQYAATPSSVAEEHVQVRDTSREGASPATHRPAHEPPSEEFWDDGLPSQRPSVAVPLVSPTSAGQHDPESTIDDDLRFLAASIQQRIHTFTFSGMLSFASSPAEMGDYQAVDLGDASSNNGPYALDPQVNGNVEFLEQEDWLIMMHTAVSTISTSSLSPKAIERCSELLAALRQEWIRMQLHKEREWLRQREAMDLCERSGAAFVDSRKCRGIYVAKTYKAHAAHRSSLRPTSSDKSRRLCSSRHSSTPAHHLQSASQGNSHSSHRVEGTCTSDARSIRWSRAACFSRLPAHRHPHHPRAFRLGSCHSSLYLLSCLLRHIPEAVSPDMLVPADATE